MKKHFFQILSKRNYFGTCPFLIHHLKVFIVIGISQLAFQGCAKSPDSKSARPDIVIILADDMGFSDIGCYGSEIETPNIDVLASRGVSFTQFYNAGRCCPTRTIL